MSNKINERAVKLMEESSQVLIRKGQDYSGGVVNEFDYFKFGVPGLDMLHTKVLRYASLMTQDKGPEFESISDTLMDLGNYAFRTAAFLKLKEEEDDKSN